MGVEVPYPQFALMIFKGKVTAVAIPKDTFHQMNGTTTAAFCELFGCVSPVLYGTYKTTNTVEYYVFEVCINT